MLKTNICPSKRSKPLQRDQLCSKIPQKRLKSQILVRNKNIQENLIIDQIQNKKKWSKNQEENLLMFLLQNIIQQPYLDFSWQFYREQQNLSKICFQLQNSIPSYLEIMNNWETLNQMRYPDLNFIDFLLRYWKIESFRNKRGSENVSKINQMKNLKSDHMRMCQDMIKQITSKQSSLMRLYNLVFQK